MSKAAWIAGTFVVLGLLGSGDDGTSGSSPSDSSYSSSDSGSTYGSSSGSYSGPTYRDSNGNSAPSDCSAWAASASNPLSYSDGKALCEGWPR